MQNKKNKKQNGGEAEGQIIFTYVLLTFLVGFILFFAYWCLSYGKNNCDQFFEDLDKGDWRGAWSNFLVKDFADNKMINNTYNAAVKELGDLRKSLN